MYPHILQNVPAALEFLLLYIFSMCPVQGFCHLFFALSVIFIPRDLRDWLLTPFKKVRMPLSEGYLLWPTNSKSVSILLSSSHKDIFNTSVHTHIAHSYTHTHACICVPDTHTHPDAHSHLHHSPHKPSYAHTVTHCLITLYPLGYLIFLFSGNDIRVGIHLLLFSLQCASVREETW